MAEAPKNAGDEAKADSPEKQSEKKGESDPLFHPTGLKRRTTVMGLAPAPHLGGLSGSPGAQARAEEEARKQRVAARLNSSRPTPLAPTTTTSSAPPRPLNEELIEPLPRPYTGPPPAAVATTTRPLSGAAARAQETVKGLSPTGPPPPARVGTGAAADAQDTVIGPIPLELRGHPLPRTGAAAQAQQTRMGHAPPPAVTGPPPPMSAVGQQPAFGTTTMLMTPPTPQVPLTLPKKTISDELPEASGWDEATDKPSDPGMASAPTVLVEEARAETYSSRPPAAQPAQGRIEPQLIETIEAPPTTERMLQAARAAQQPPAAQQPVITMSTAPTPVVVTSSSAPPAALALRPYEPAHTRHAVSGPLDKRLVLLNEPDSARAAGFRGLRDSLLGKSMPRVVAVSSAAPHEGKTTCAINLALALAEQPSTRVLLLDGNFFDPELARIFHLDRLGDVTPSESWLAPYKIGAITESLHVAGIVRSDSSTRRFEQHRFETMIDRLCRANYDYLIIDTPALRGSLAAGTLVASADGTVLAVRAGKTTAAELRRAVAQIPSSKALGITLMDATSQH